MLAPERQSCESERQGQADSEPLLDAERDFYEGYPWTLNPHLTVREVIEYLGEQIAILPATRRGWQSDEVLTNIYLLSCALLNSVDEYLRGPSLRLPSRVASMRVGKIARWLFERAMINRRPRREGYVRNLRGQWLAALGEFLSVIVANKTPDPSLFADARAKLAALLEIPFPSDLFALRAGVPSPFRRLDLTQHDIIALGERYVQRFPDRSDAILLVGLRTSGSYFAPLLQAYFGAQGYKTVSSLTLAPSKGAGRWERKEMARYAARGYTAVIVDDPPHTGGAILTAFEIVGKTGFSQSRMRVLAPTHSARRDLFKPFADGLVVTLDPEHWYKPALLRPETVQRRLAEYFSARNFTKVSVVGGDSVEKLNERLNDNVSDERGARLKQIFEVELATREGRSETRYVLAKSVGWGWLGYHAFLAGQRLAGFVPPILGLRDGMLYMAWIPDSVVDSKNDCRHLDAHIETAASYIAARTRCLSLADDSLKGKEPPRQNNGTKLLRDMLSRAYGIFPANILAQRRVGRLLRQEPCPLPTFIDGKMRLDEWVLGPHGLLKTDYEHHGLGKEELNIIDPAYDLADTILNWCLSSEEEARLVTSYIKESGDIGVEQRLPLNKLLAGLWGMKRAHDQLFDKAANSERQQVFHQRFMTAWDFLTVQTARYCGRQCRPNSPVRWQCPLVVTDIDGVLDQRIFGFPSTTAAGIEALATLHAHDFSVAINTARSVSEVKAYCDAYGLAGGVAEHGSYIWDAVNQRGRVLIDSEALAQIEELRRHLRKIPGVFLDDRHQFTIRAFTYRDKARGFKRKVFDYIRSAGVGDGVVAPIPTLLMRHLMTELKLDRLCYHHTDIDTTVVTKDVSKGSGLLALRDQVLGEGGETIAIGDQEPDLSMFRVASQSFAPANIGCKREARLLGCQIVGQSFQNGFLEISRKLAASNGRDCGPPCASVAALRRDCLLMEILHTADRSWGKNLGAVALQTIFSRA